MTRDSWEHKLSIVGSLQKILDHNASKKGALQFFKTGNMLDLVTGNHTYILSILFLKGSNLTKTY